MEHVPEQQDGALFRARIGIWLAWLLAGEFIYDTVTNIQAGAQEHLFGQARGISWLVVGVYVPLLVVTTVLLMWQLYSRRVEALSRTAAVPPHNVHIGQLEIRGQA